MNPLRNTLLRNARFGLSVLIGLVLLFGTIALISAAAERLQGGIGTAIAIVAGACLVFGLLLGYWNFVDWHNLRVMRHAARATASDSDDGKVIAFSGVVRADDGALVAPFSHTPAAAYHYIVSTLRRSHVGVSSDSGGRTRRHVLAQGFHMASTSIEGKRQTLRLCSFPGLEDELRELDEGKKWRGEARELTNRFFDVAPTSGERVRHGRLLEVRHSIVDEVHEDYCLGRIANEGVPITVEEEVLPLDQEVCVIGTYDAKLKGLTARQARPGPNLMIYRGNLDSATARIAKDVAWFARIAGWLIGIGLVVFVFAFLPAAWTSKLPLIGPLFIYAL